MKKILHALVLLISSYANGQVQLFNDVRVERFYWGDTLNGKYCDKAAMFVPLQVDTIKGDYYAQFDLGCSGTILYGASIEPMLASHPLLRSRIDSIGISDDGKPLFKIDKLRLHSGSLDLGTKMVYGFYHYGDAITMASIKPENRTIGTVGADAVQGKVLIIDFPGQWFAIADRLSTSSRSKFTFTKFDVINNKIIIPVAINGVTYHFMYDSGSSIFSLLTTQELWAACTDPRVLATLDVTNFGNHIKLAGSASVMDMNFNGRNYTGYSAYHAPDGFFDTFFKTELRWYNR